MSDLFDTGLLPADPEPDPPPRRRRDRSARKRKRRRRTALAVLLPMLMLGGLAVGAVLVLKPLFTDRDPAEVEDYAGPGTGSATAVIPDGASGADIADVLHDAGIVASTKAFVQAFTAEPDAAQIQPGTYELQRKMRAGDVVTALLDPANRSELRITVPEGWRASQIYERIASITQEPIEDVEAAAEDTEELGLPEQADGNLEGWLAAATYSFEPDVEPGAILEAMVDQTLENLDDLDVPSDEQQEVLTIASIVEREVFVAEDYGKVARVILNRLDDTDDVNGRLQMDSTVLYGAGKTGGIPTRAELDDDNPYNTYRNPGLPPTPIGAPGAGAIEAVLDPPKGDWLYFVTVDLHTGETLFAGDYAEHQRNKQQLGDWLEENSLTEEEAEEAAPDGPADED